jgi:hypothetical protein
MKISISPIGRMRRVTVPLGHLVGAARDPRAGSHCSGKISLDVVGELWGDKGERTDGWWTFFFYFQNHARLLPLTSGQSPITEAVGMSASAN